MAAAYRTHRVAILHGDGIGPSLIAAALQVNAAAEAAHGFRLLLDEVPTSEDPAAPRLGEQELARLRAANAVLKGPAGQPEKRSTLGTETFVLGGILRPALQTHANIRPIRTWRGAPSIWPEARDVDYVVVRENLEGLYASRAGGARSPHAAADTLLVTRAGTDRIARHAFGLARQRADRTNAPSVTCVDKANVLPSHAFFRQVVEEVAADFPDVAFRTAHADAMTQTMTLDPWSLDVLVMENFLGDILSELGAATVGGVGMAPSANIGDEHAYFEPAHGSAPALTGQDRANPVGQILALAMLLDHCEEHEAAAAVTRAVAEAFATGDVALDETGCPTHGTAAAARAIAAHVA